MAVENPPPGYAGVTPYLVVKGAGEALDWYQKALGAVLAYKMEWGGKIGHAELKIGGGYFMLAEEFPGMGNLSPQSRGGTTVSMLVYVDDVDAAYSRAIEAGATVNEAVEDKPWGDRAGNLTDPFGHKWMLATHVEDVAPDEMERRMAALAPKG